MTYAWPSTRGETTKVALLSNHKQLLYGLSNNGFISDNILETTSSVITTYNSCLVDLDENKSMCSKEPTRANKNLIVSACSRKG
jgi:hypothetical protein